jgi:alpha-galactosidase
MHSPALPHTQQHALANSARIGPDDTNWNGVLTDIDDMIALSTNAGAGGWDDPCLLLGADENGHEAQTDQQSRFQFTAWALLAAPMILSQNIVNISPFRLETYLNEEVIAVGQDLMGRQGILLAGGKLSIAPRSLAEHLARRNGGEVRDPRTVFSPDELRRLRGSTWAASGDGNTPLSLLPCASPVSTLQTWSWNVSGTGDNYVQNTGTQLCVNTDDCSASLIAYTCVNTGTSCANNFDNLRFVLNADGTLRTPSQPGNCAVGAPGLQVTLAPCSGAASQQWAYNTATKQLTSGNQCLTVGDGAADRTAVIGRPLADGSWALGFFNAGLSAGDVVCDSSCIAGMGFESSQAFAVRDLYAHADLPNSPAGANITASALAGSGGVALLKVLPIFDAPIPPPPADL